MNGTEKESSERLTSGSEVERPMKPGALNRKGEFKEAPSNAFEDNYPEQLENLLVEIGEDPTRTLREACRAAGIPEKRIASVMRRMQGKFGLVKEEIESVSTQKITEMIEDRLVKALTYLDDVVLADASAKDLGIVVGILTEKRQLLRNQPTEILSIEERDSLTEMIPALLQEAHRRGMVIDLDPTQYESLPAPNVRTYDTEKQVERASSSKRRSKYSKRGREDG